MGPAGQLSLLRGSLTWVNRREGVRAHSGGVRSMERQTTTVTIEVPEGASMGPFAHLLRAPSEGHAILPAHPTAHTTARIL